MANRLAHSTSPYLLQHQDNAVDWFEWGEEAFAQARARDVPIFLSIGYSACHWCHVMAHESFEDVVLAEFLNSHFVSIKVDREERPDIDSIYMEATVALTGHGGWPMTVFLDHQGQPFYAGTYFPPTPRPGMPSFGQLISSISATWEEKKDDVIAAGQRIITALNNRSAEGERTDLGALEPTDIMGVLRAAVSTLDRSFDQSSGGFGGSPKFPPSMVLEFLLRMATDPNVGDQALVMAERTLEAMARGGIYDQLGGGFARYSVDARWVVPHFEKMLYDNALLIRVYSHWWRLTHNPLAKRVVHESVEFLLREMLTDQGAFAAALDADSEGHEGKFYAWNKSQIAQVVGAEKAEDIANLLEVTEAGTFEHGTSTLQLLRDPSDGVDRVDWADAKAKLFDARAQRIRPERDDKVVAAWNGLAISALADAGAIFEKQEWIAAAERAADVILSVHLGRDGRPRAMSRTSRDGLAGNNDAVLDDYANMSAGMLSLYEVTGKEEWRDLSRELLTYALDHFSDESGGFFDTADNVPQLVRRPREVSDNAEPSGWLAMAELLVRFAGLAPDDHQQLRERAEKALAVVPEFAVSAPRAVGWGMVALWSLAQGPWEVAVSGNMAPEFAGVAMKSPLAPTIRWDHSAGEGAQVCRHSVCELPTGDTAELMRFLRVKSDTN